MVAWGILARTARRRVRKLSGASASGQKKLQRRQSVRPNARRRRRRGLAGSESGKKGTGTGQKMMMPTAGGGVAETAGGRGVVIHSNTSPFAMVIVEQEI